MQYHERASLDVWKKIISNYQHVITLDKDAEVQFAENVNTAEAQDFLTFIETFNLGFLCDIEQPTNQ